MIPKSLVKYIPSELRLNSLFAGVLGTFSPYFSDDLRFKI